MALEVELGPDLTAEEAGRILERGQEAAVFARLQWAMLLKQRGADAVRRGHPRRPRAAGH